MFYAAVHFVLRIKYKRVHVCYSNDQDQEVQSINQGHRPAEAETSLCETNCKTGHRLTRYFTSEKTGSTRTHLEKKARVTTSSATARTNCIILTLNPHSELYASVYSPQTDITMGTSFQSVCSKPAPDAVFGHFPRGSQSSVML